MPVKKKYTMKRLTGWDKGNPYLLKCFEGKGCRKMDTSGCNGLCKHETAAYFKLAAYEDTGLTPEEISGMNDFINSQCAKLFAENSVLKAENERYRKAETEGRMVVLPCARGNVLYRIIGDDIFEECVKDIIFRAVGDWGLYSHFGKTVFLTREEAEAALAAKKGAADETDHRPND